MEIKYVKNTSDNLLFMESIEDKKKDISLKS